MVAAFTRSLTGVERASTVERYPEPKMIDHQSSGRLRGCHPGSSATFGSVTPHSIRSAWNGAGSTILLQGLIDFSNSGSSRRTASQNFASAGSNVFAPQIVIAKRPWGLTRRHNPRTVPVKSGTKNIPKTEITASKD